VTKTGTTGERSRVDFATVNGSTDPATGGGACGGNVDYITQTGTLAFTPSDTTKTITVSVCGDARTEVPETFFVNLSNPVNASISDGQGLGTITDDDVCTPPNIVYVNHDWSMTPVPAFGDDPDDAGPATSFGCDSFAKIQEGINGVAGSGTVIVYAGTYAENVVVNKSVTLQGPNSGVDPNQIPSTRSAEAIVVPATVETSVQGSTSGTVFRVGTNSGHIDVTINGFTIDGHNEKLNRRAHPQRRRGPHGRRHRQQHRFVRHKPGRL
jgi:hypothetical protein